jgi:hypothetical protein
MIFTKDVQYFGFNNICKAMEEARAICGGHQQVYTIVVNPRDFSISSDILIEYDYCHKSYGNVVYGKLMNCPNIADVIISEEHAEPGHMKICCIPYTLLNEFKKPYCTIPQMTKRKKVGSNKISVYNVRA